MSEEVITRLGGDEEEAEAIRDWSRLPADMVRVCADLIDCNVDLANMASQCTTWRGAIGANLRSVQLPWMLVPYSSTCFLGPGVLREANFFCFLSNRVHKVPQPSYASTARFFGAYDDGWLFAAFGHCARYAIINLRTRVKLDLPSSFVCAAFPIGEPMVLRAATLSCSPLNKSSCVVGAICTTIQSDSYQRTFLAFSRLGASDFSAITNVHLEDVLYSGRSFYFLTGSEDLIVCTPEFNQSSHPNSLVIHKNFCFFVPSEQEHGLRVKSRYLVHIGGEIMMVVRYACPSSEMTNSFAFFRIAPVDTSSVFYKWIRVTELVDYHAIFVGKGSSRCFQAGQFRAFTAGVYFHDDDIFNMPEMVSCGIKDDNLSTQERLILGGNRRAYPCHDNGCWRGGGQPIKRWMQWSPTSTYTPPVWYFR